MKQLLIAAALSCLCLQAFAGGGGIDMSIEAENLAVDTTTSIKTAASLEQEVQEVANQMQSLQYQVQNLKGFNSVIWDSTAQNLQKLASIVNQGQSLSYSMQNLDGVFQQKYPGYVAQQDYSKSYQSWSQTTLDTLRGTLESAGLQAQDFSTEEGTIDQLRQMARTESGRQQALEVGNQIAAENVNQMQNLRQLVINQTNAQNAYMAYQIEKDQSGTKAAEDYINNADDTYPAYQNNQAFGHIPNFNP